MHRLFLPFGFMLIVGLVVLAYKVGQMQKIGGDIQVAVETKNKQTDPETKGKSNDLEITNQVSQINRKLDRLTGRVADLEKTLVFLEADSVQDSRANEDLIDDVIQQETDEALSLDEVTRRDDERFQYYENQILHEVVDDQWVAGMEGHFLSFEKNLRNFHMTGTELSFVECKSTMCMAEFSHKNEEERSMLPLVVAVDGTSRVTIKNLDVGDDKKPRSVAFFAREGHELPSIQAVDPTNPD